MNKPQLITVLGSTGSIGKSTLDVVARHPDKYQIYALTAYQQDELLFEQCCRFKPRFAVMLDEQAGKRLVQRIATAGLKTEVLCGVAALEQVSASPDVDAVMAAIVGAAGLRPTRRMRCASHRAASTSVAGPFPGRAMR